jgi:hypothetical protein
VIIDVRTVNTYWSDGTRQMMVKLVYGAHDRAKLWVPVWSWTWKLSDRSDP